MTDLVSEPSPPAEPPAKSKPQDGFRPLDSRLSPEVRLWVEELRTVWAGAGMSMTRFACLNHFDKGTLSRYLSGRRVPRDHFLLDRLLALRAEQGKEVSPQVRKHLTDLQLQALQVAHPHEYRVRLVNDELELAVVAQHEAERHARSLEEQLVDVNRRLDELTDHLRRLRAAWDADRTDLQAEKERLEAEVAELHRLLEGARCRATEAEQRCQDLEDLLEQMDAPSSGVSDSVRGLSLEDPAEVTRLLDILLKIGAAKDASWLAGRAAAKVPLDDIDAVTLLLKAVREAGTSADTGMLAVRAATSAPLDDADTAMRLLDVMLTVGARPAARYLATRVANETALYPSVAIDLIEALLRAIAEAGTRMDLTIMVRRIVEGIPLDSPDHVWSMMHLLRNRGFERANAALARRIAREASVATTAGITELLDLVWFAGSKVDYAHLAARVAEQMPMADASAVARLLEILWLRNAQSEATTLAKRIDAGWSLADPDGVRRLLAILRERGADEEAVVRVARSWLLTDS